MPVNTACESLTLPRSAWYRHIEKKHGLSTKPTQPVARRPTPPNTLTEEERQTIRSTLNSERFANQAIPQVHAQLLDEGQYLASESAMYRIMREHGEVRDRRNQLSHPPRSAPVLRATQPNQVWSWDITKLRGQLSGMLFYLYVVLDIFSRYVVGWLAAQQQSSELAGLLIGEAMRKQGLLPDSTQKGFQPVIKMLSDNGGPMTAKPLMALYDDLGVHPVHTRPHTPNDNAYSESQFRTLKYRPDYPERFDSLLDVRGWSQDFFAWYNTQHHHSGIAMLTPETVHLDRVAHCLAQRRLALTTAFAAHPERFRYRMPLVKQPPQEVWINRPLNVPGLIQPALFTKL